MDYFRIIHNYIAPTSETYPLYLIHCTLVAKMALEIAERLALSAESQRFIEEAAMLHDIGIIHTNMPVIFCDGSLPYLYHLTEGRKILEQEGVLRHAQVAQRHSGLSLTAKGVTTAGFAMGIEQFMPQLIEEEIINFADLFYSKDVATLWRKRSVAEVRQSIDQYAPSNVGLFNQWVAKFREI